MLGLSILCSLFYHSQRISQLNPFLSTLNATLTSHHKIKGQFITSPVITSLPRFDQRSLSIHKMRFSRLAQSVIRGWASELTVSRTMFKNSISPLRLSGNEPSKMKSISSRIVHREQNIVLRESVFDFCTSLTEDGGAVFLDSGELVIVDTEFIHAVARNGGGIYVVNGQVSIESCSS